MRKIQVFRIFRNDFFRNLIFFRDEKFNFKNKKNFLWQLCGFKKLNLTEKI